MSTQGKVIKCKAAVAWRPKEPLKIEEVDVAPPKSGEVRIKIVASGVCHTDAFTLGGEETLTHFPVILGHEGAGIVESVGEGVTSVAPGDHVIPLYTSQCKECEYCLNPNTNICHKIWDTQESGLMPDGTTRFSVNGQPIFHYMGTSTFTEYTVVADISVAKINPNAPLDTVGLLGCGISTGYGAALNTANVKKGSTVAVWGLGAIGLSAIMGAKEAGAREIVAIDINPGKFKTAREFGATQCINPLDYPDKPFQETLIEKFNGGFDYTFEACGTINTMKCAFDSTHDGWGVAVIIGLAPFDQDLSFKPFMFLLGKTWKGTYFGGWRGIDQVPELVEKYLKKELKLDEFITHRLPLSEINKAFDLMHKGESLRTMISLN